MAGKEAEVLWGSGEYGLKWNGSEFLLVYSFLISSVAFLQKGGREI